MAQMTGSQDQRTTKQPAARSSHRTAKVTELIGSSKEGFEDAVASALRDASATLRHISAADIVKFSVKCEEGEITEYRADIKIAFGIER